MTKVLFKSKSKVSFGLRWVKHCMIYVFVRITSTFLLTDVVSEETVVVSMAEQGWVMRYLKGTSMMSFFCTFLQQLIHSSLFRNRIGFVVETE